MDNNPILQKMWKNCVKTSSKLCVFFANFSVNTFKSLVRLVKIPTFSPSFSSFFTPFSTTIHPLLRTNIIHISTAPTTTTTKNN